MRRKLTSVSIEKNTFNKNDFTLTLADTLGS